MIAVAEPVPAPAVAPAPVPMPVPIPALAALAPLAARAFASGEELADAVLDLVRSVTGLDTALVVRTAGDDWTAVHARSDHFGVQPGDRLPLQDTF